MLEYSGTLLHGLRQMGLNDVFDNLKRITCDHRYRAGGRMAGLPPGATRWRRPRRCRISGCTCRPGSTTSRRSSAWRRWAACAGSRPPEMALPNHPDTAYEFVKTLKDCGYQWVLVQEHTVERPENGQGPERKHLPHRLVCRNSRGRGGRHHRHHQDPGQRHQAGRPDAAVLRGQGALALGTGRQAGPAAGDANRRRRERRRDDERVPVASISRSCASAPAPSTAGRERHRIPGVPRSHGHQGGGPARRAAHLPEADLGPVQARRGAGRAWRRSSNSSRRRTTASTWRAAVGRTTSPGCAATNRARPDGEVPARSSTRRCSSRACRQR